MPKTATALSDEDIRRKYYETAGHQNWITEMQLDPLQLIVCDDGTGKYFRVGVTLNGGEISFAEPKEVAINYVDLSAKLSAIVYENRAESLSGVPAPATEVITTPPPAATSITLSVPSAVDHKEIGRQVAEAIRAYESGGGTPGFARGGVTPPPPPPAPPAPVAPDVSPAGAAIRKMAAATQTPPPASPGGGSVSATEQEASGMPFDAAKLREALGLSETASADDALTAFAGALSTLGGQGAAPATGSNLTASDAAAPAPVAVPQLADGNRPVLLDPSQLAALQESARKGETAWAQLRRNERDGVLDDAIRLGKFPASRREYWVQLWDRDPDGTRQAVSALATNVIPVLSTGYTGDDAAHRSAADQAYEGLFGKENH